MSSRECPDKNVQLKMSSRKCPVENVQSKISSPNCPVQNFSPFCSRLKCVRATCVSKSKPISRFALRAMVICKNKQDVGFGKGGPNFSPFCSKMNRFRDIKQNVLCAKRERQNKEGNITCFFLQTSCAKRESRNPESNFPFPFARNAKREMLNPTFLSPLRETRSAKQKRGKTGQNCDWTKKKLDKIVT